MKKSLLSISILSIICLQCATPQDIKTRINNEDYTSTVTYNYNWETVYSAIEYVFEHSKMQQIAGRRSDWNIAFHKDDKSIWVILPIQQNLIDFTVFFEPLSEQTVRVKFVRAASEVFRGDQREIVIKYLIDESIFYLANDGNSYDKYTYNNNKNYQLEYHKKFIKDFKQ